MLFSHLIWMGDLNYRIDLWSESKIKSMLDENKIEILLKYDQVCYIKLHNNNNNSILINYFPFSSLIIKDSTNRHLVDLKRDQSPFFLLINMISEQ